MNIRKAKLSDIEQIYEIINFYANENAMLPRSRSSLYENIRDFAVAEKNGEILGVGALHILWIDIAELRSLAVKNDVIKQGIGKEIVRFLLNEAKNLEIPKVFTLTYKPEFFKKSGFLVIDKDMMPRKVWSDCINCPKFPNCNEVCLEINITN